MKLSLDHYWNGAWHYPDDWSEGEIVQNALEWAAHDFGALTVAGVEAWPGHPFTTTPKAIQDALNVAPAESYPGEPGPAEMIRDLQEAVHGFSYATAHSPEAEWRELLRIVRTARARV